MRGNPFLKQAQEEDFPTCPGCNEQVFPRERPVRALGANWHPTCLKCSTCKTLLNVRSLESYQNKPYCRAHRPTATATQVADDAHIKQATSVPKAAERAAGVDVTARRSFAAPGRNVRLDAHADRTADRFANDRRTDTGEFTKEAAPSATNAGINWADSTHKPDTGEFVREGGTSRTVAGYGWADSSHRPDQGEYGSTPSASASSAGHAWSDPSHQHDTGEYVREAAARPAPTQSSAPSFASRAPPAAAAPPPVRAAPAAAPPSPMVAETYHDQSYDQGSYDQSDGYDQGAGYDQGSYDQGSYDQSGGYDQGAGYDQGSYDQSGYDQGAYDQGGYDQSGQGYDQQYYEGGEGYDQQYSEGQNQEGYDHQGYEQQY